MRAQQETDNSAHLFSGQDGGHPLGSFGAYRVNGAIQVFLEHLTVQEQQGAESLILR